MHHLTSPIIVAALAGSVAAQPVVDGSIAGDAYGAAASVQTVETGFGDNQSELNAAYARIHGGKLYLTLTGNIEDNFNKIELFFDSRAGGENTFSGLPGNDGTGNMTGMTFDSGFNADYHMIFRRGNAGTDRFDVDYAVLGTGDFSFYADVFGGAKEGVGTTGTGANAFPITIGYDNSNTGGVAGGTGAANQADALSVLTGLEIAIDLADLGAPAGAFKVMAFINNQDHNYASNQFLGGLQPPQGNLGGDGFGSFTGGIDWDLNDFAGEQYFTVVPAPGAAAVLGLAGLVGLRRRR